MRFRKQSIALASMMALTAVSCTRDPNVLKRKYVESGDQFVAKKSYSDAIIQYRKAVATDGSFGEARLKLGGAYERTGDLRNALGEFVRAADLMPKSVPAQVAAAKMLLAAGQFPEAKSRALAALQVEPKNVAALLALGNSLAGMKDIDGAIAQIDGAIDAQPRVAFSYTNLGLLQMKKGNASAAEGAFKRAVDVDPKSPTALLNLGSYYWASGDLPAAERELKAALRVDSKSADANRILAVFYETNGRRAEAEPYLKAYAAVTSAVAPKLALADFYLADEKIKEASEVLGPLSNNKEGFAPAKLRLAAIDFRAGHRDQAYQTLDEILKRDPKNAQVLESKARFLIIDRRFDEALKIATAVVQSDQQAATSHYLRGVALSGLGSTDDAIKAMQRVLELVPAAAPAQIQIATLQLDKHDPKAAIDFLNPLVKKQPRSANLHLLMGMALLEIGNLPGAEAELVPLSRAVPKSAELQSWLGRLYSAKRDLPRAREAFGKALELQPDSITALNGIISIDIVEKRGDAARAKLEARLASEPDNEALLFLAGNSYLTMGDAAKAETLLRKVLQVNPANIDAYARLVRIYWAQNRLDQAKAELEEAARHQSSPVAARTMIGLILELQKQPDQARKQYEQALALNPRAPVAANNLAMQHAELGNLDIALQLAQTAKAVLPDDARISDTLGWIYYKKGLSTLAVTALQQSVKQNPAIAETQYHLGLAHLKNGDQGDARRALQQALKLNPQFSEAADAKRVLSTLKG
jgi:tetratricopeptide (TPR) repeat protein